MSIEHDFFGLVDSTEGGGLIWQDTVELGDQPVEVTLSADDEDTVSETGLDLAAAMVRALEPLDARARDALVAQLSERESATLSYLDRQIDGRAGDLESLLDLLVDNSGDIAIDVLRSLQLVRVALHPENTDDEDAFAVFDYSLDPDASDELLIVTFTSTGDVIDVEDAEDGV